MDETGRNYAKQYKPGEKQTSYGITCKWKLEKQIKETEPNKAQILELCP